MKHPIPIRNFSEQSLKDRMTNLGIEASLKLTFMGGLISVSGSAKYLHEEKAKQEDERLTFVFKKRSKQVTIDGNALINKNLCNTEGATHVITDVIYGSNAYLSFDKSVNDFSKKKEIAGSLHATITSIPSFSLDADAELQMEDHEREFVKDLHYTYHGDVLDMISPTTFQEAVVLVKTLEQKASEMTKAGTERVVLYSIAPLSDFCGGEAKILNDISNKNIQRVEEIMLDFEEINQRLRKLSSSRFANRFAKYGGMLDDIKTRHGNFKHKITSELKRILPEIRRNSVLETELSNLIAEYDNSPFQKSRFFRLLDVRQKEIETAESIIYDGNMPNGVILDYENSGAANNCTFNSDFVVDFVLNILPSNSSAIGTLYESNRWVDESYKWFMDRTKVQGLRPLTQKFFPFAKENKDKSICFILSLRTTEEDIYGLNYNIEFIHDAQIKSRNFQPPGRILRHMKKQTVDTWVRLKIRHDPISNYKGVVHTKYIKMDNTSNWKEHDSPLEYNENEIDVKLQNLDPNSLYLIESQISLYIGDTKIGSGPKSEKMYVMTKQRGDNCPANIEGCPIENLRITKIRSEKHHCFLSPFCNSVSSAGLENYPGNGLICDTEISGSFTNYDYCCETGSYGDINECDMPSPNAVMISTGQIPQNRIPQNCPKRGCPIDDLRPINTRMEPFFCSFDSNCPYVASLDPHENKNGLNCIFGLSEIYENHDYCCESGEVGSIPGCNEKISPLSVYPLLMDENDKDGGNSIGEEDRWEFIFED